MLKLSRKWIFLFLVLLISTARAIISLEVNPDLPVYRNKDATITADWQFTGNVSILNLILKNVYSYNVTGDVDATGVMNASDFCIGSYCLSNINTSYLALDGSNQASWTPTTTKVTNLNADLLDGYNTGTSGSVIPLLSGANTWSNHQKIAESYDVNFKDSDMHIRASDSDTLLVESKTDAITLTGEIQVLGHTIALFGNSANGQNIRVAIGGTPATGLIRLNGYDGAGLSSDIGGRIEIQPGTGGAFGSNGYFVVNENSDDVDTRFESNGNANMFFLDAGQDRIGIGTNSPAKTLDVNGAIIANDYYSGDGSQGITDSSSYWLCTASDCSSSCQVNIEDGLIVGCS